MESKMIITEIRMPQAPTPFKVGDWVCNKNRTKEDPFLMCIQKIEASSAWGYGISFDNSWFNYEPEGKSSIDQIYQEIAIAETAFIEESLLNYSNTHYPSRTKINNLITEKEVIVKGLARCFSTSNGEIQLIDNYGGVIYSNGIWAEKTGFYFPPIFDSTFNVGDKVRITNSGETFLAYKAAFKELGFRSTIFGRDCSDGDTGIVTFITSHPLGKTLLAIKLKDGREIIVSSLGVEVVKGKEKVLMLGNNVVEPALNGHKVSAMGIITHSELIAWYERVKPRYKNDEVVNYDLGYYDTYLDRLNKTNNRIGYIRNVKFKQLTKLYKASKHEQETRK